MQAEEKGTEARGPMIKLQGSGEKINGTRCCQVEQDCRQMPSPGVQTKDLEIQNGPEDKQWPVINLTPAGVKPKVTEEDSRDRVPRANQRVIDNLRDVVPYEVKRERTVVDNESNSSNEEQRDPRSLELAYDRGSAG